MLASLGSTEVHVEPRDLAAEVETTDDPCSDSSDQSVEFDLMAETDIDAAWCISADDTTSWDPSSSCGTLKRRWEEFERLPTFRAHSHLCEVGRPADGAGAAGQFAQLSREELRALMLETHPDKGGTAEEFMEVMKAVRTAEQREQRLWR